MAASSRHVGRYVHKNSRFLLNNFEHLWGHRSFSCTTAVSQQTVTATKESTEDIVIPRKKTWSKVAVLETLASTVNRDSTACQYQFQDDSYLAPRTSAEFKLYTVSEEAGRAAAKFFIDSHPKFFTKDFAEPHIPCLMPDSVMVSLEEVSEEALRERINLRKVTAAIDMYDQVLQAGTAVSMETTCDLLDLICLYGDSDPVQEGGPQTQDTEEARRGKGRARWGSDLPKDIWKENNNAERIFNLLPERDTRCYSALIRGMVKHGAYVKAFNLYTDLLNNRLTADVHIFNALISAAPELKDKYNEKWELIVELLNQMSQQKVEPNLLTFNSVLRALRRCGGLAKSQSLHTLSEMRALGIAPSLASYDHILAIFYRSASLQPPAHSQMNILQEVMSELAGGIFTCQDPDDVLFFSTAMRICVDNKDLDQAYRILSLTEVRENWRLLGDSYQQSMFYGRFFSLLCMMEHIDVVLKWYRKLIPSLYYPSPWGMRDLLQALDTDGRLDLLPTIWKDIKSFGHGYRAELVEELLGLMSRERHSPEVQESFAVCALDVKSVFEEAQGRTSLKWTNSSLSHITSLLLRANRTQLAWEMLQLFKTNNRIPPEELLEDFLSLCCSTGAPQRAVELVQLSGAFCLPTTPRLAQRVLKDFDLTDEQRNILSGMELSAEPTD